VYRVRPLAAGASASAIQLDIDDLFDIQGLANELAQYGRTVATRVRSVSGTALSIVAAGALLAGAPAIAAGAVGLAAVTWLATTGVAVGTGLALEAGTSAVLNGKASLEDLKPSAVYAWDAYMEQAEGYVQSKVLEETFGPTWGSVVDAGINVYGTVHLFLDQDVEQAFDAGTIPQNGYPQSNFALAVSPQYEGGGTYTVTVTTSPATDGATIRLQVSGTDGYRASEDRATAGGVATFSFPSGQPGVRDAINAIHVEGRAAGSATLTF
jgi:hypothetical protein